MTSRQYLLKAACCLSLKVVLIKNKVELLMNISKRTVVSTSKSHSTLITMYFSSYYRKLRVQNEILEYQ